MFQFTSVGTRNELTRDAWVKMKLTNIDRGAKILDAGAGEQKYRKDCHHLDYTSQDFSKYFGRGNGQGIQTGSWDPSKTDIVCDITDIPVANGSFDVVLNTEVLEHIPEPVRAIQEFHRILKPGGSLILTAPFSSLTHFAPYHYYSGFNKYFFEYHFERIGFRMEELNFNGNFFEYTAQEVRRISDMAITYCNKSRLRFYERILVQLVLGILQRLSRRDLGSQECQNFGIHIVAIKSRESS